MRRLTATAAGRPRRHNGLGARLQRLRARLSIWRGGVAVFADEVAVPCARRLITAVCDAYDAGRRSRFVRRHRRGLRAARQTLLVLWFYFTFVRVHIIIDAPAVKRRVANPPPSTLEAPPGYFDEPLIRPTGNTFKAYPRYRAPKKRPSPWEPIRRDLTALSPETVTMVQLTALAVAVANVAYAVAARAVVDSAREAAAVVPEAAAEAVAFVKAAAKSAAVSVRQAPRLLAVEGRKRGRKAVVDAAYWVQGLPRPTGVEFHWRLQYFDGEFNEHIFVCA